MRETDESYFFSFRFNNRHRKLLAVAAGMFDAERVERLARASAPVIAKIGGMLIREAQNVETGVFQQFAVTRRDAESKTARRTRRAFRRRSAFEQRTFEIAESDIR